MHFIQSAKSTKHNLIGWSLVGTSGAKGLPSIHQSVLKQAGRYVLRSVIRIKGDADTLETQEESFYNCLFTAAAAAAAVNHGKIRQALMPRSYYSNTRYVVLHCAELHDLTLHAVLFSLSTLSLYLYLQCAVLVHIFVHMSVFSLTQMKGLDINSNCTQHSITMLKVAEWITWCIAYLSVSKITDLEIYCTTSCCDDGQRNALMKSLWVSMYQFIHDLTKDL